MDWRECLLVGDRSDVRSGRGLRSWPVSDAHDSSGWHICRRRYLSHRNRPDQYQPRTACEVFGRSQGQLSDDHGDSCGRVGHSRVICRAIDELFRHLYRAVRLTSIGFTAKRLLHPRSHVSREFREPGGSVLQIGPDAIGIDAQISVNEDVPETAEALQPGGGRCCQHTGHPQLRDDILVVLCASAKVGAEDMVADVEDDLGSHLQTALDGPRVAETLWLSLVQLLESRGHVFEAKQALPDGFRPNDQAAAPRSAGASTAIAPPETA